MSAPNRPGRPNIRAPFKSPLKISNHSNSKENILKSDKVCDHTSVKNSIDIKTDQNIDEQIDNCLKSLLQSRPNQTQIDLENELSIWRNRLHEYNDAKDTCLTLFGRLAHQKGCLVRELYQEFGLDLED